MDYSTCFLKVNIGCCNACPVKAKKILEKIDGVYSVTTDAENGMIKVSGKVDPMILIKKLSKKGKKAELLSYEKDPMEDQNQQEGQFKSMNTDQDKCWRNDKEKNAHRKGKKKGCCHSDHFDDEPNDYKFSKADEAFDENICRDIHCKIHNRRLIIGKDRLRDNAAMVWSHPDKPRGHFPTSYPPVAPHLHPPYRHYCAYERHVQPILFDRRLPPYDHHNPELLPPAYGHHPRRLPLPAVDDFTHLFSDDNTRGCSVM